MDRKNAPPPAAEREGDEQDSIEMLDSIASFIRKYLICDNHQLTVLTLWVVHTWCYARFLTTAYLEIQSPEPQSGKSRCLELLLMLCNSPSFATSSNSRTICDRLLHQRSIKEIAAENRSISVRPPHTLLLDNCDHLLGPSEHQTLLAMLASGTRQSSFFAFGKSDYCLFGPKAFAGNGRLPRSLAAHCIPIVLRRKKPYETVARFNRDLDRLPANVVDWLKQVACDPYVNSEKTLQPPPQLPSDLSARQQDCAEPLLHVADSVGGSWPEKARAAISAIFELSERSDSIQVLSDIRAWFHMNNNPEYMLSRDLLPLLTSMDQRPWSGWTNKSGRKLGALLQPFGIFSRRLNVGSERSIKGYLLKDFADSWERYLPPLHRETAPSSSRNGESDADGGRVDE